MNERELRQKAKNLIDQMEALNKKALAENRNFTAEEQTQYDAAKAEVRNLQAQLDRLREQEEFRTWAGSPSGQPVARSDPNDTGGTPHVTVTSDPADRPFRNVGEQLIAVTRATRSNGRDVNPRLLRLNDLAIQEARATGMSEAVPADGGYAVEKDAIQGIWQRSYETGLLASKAQRLQVGPNSNGIKMNAIDESSRVNGSRWGGIQGYWMNETGAPTKSKPKLRKVNIDLEKMAALLYATEELLTDASALTSLVNQGVPQEFGFMLDDAMVNANGAGLPLGILNSPALITVAKESSQAAATVLAANIYKMWSRMWARSRMNAGWYINQDVESQLPQLVIAVKNVAGTENVGGLPVFVPAGQMASAPHGALLGRPIQPIEQCATLGTVGDIIFADFSQYALIEKDGIQSATSIHVKFEEGETAFRFIMRVNGKPMWDVALTPFKGSNTLSPFVALATRS